MEFFTKGVLSICNLFLHVLGMSLLPVLNLCISV